MKGSLISVCLLVQALQVLGAAGIQDPTDGYVSLPLNSTNFHVQSPYDVPEGGRYSFNDGVHKFWVLSSDKPHALSSHTAPRAEIGVLGYNYSWGVWQFEGHVYVPDGTSGASIMQIFGASSRATTLMLWVHNGALMYYGLELIADEIYGKWIRVNVIHNVGEGHVKVLIDGELKLVVKDRGGHSHNFKFGVYAQKYSSYFMESRWKGIKVLKLPN